MNQSEALSKASHYVQEKIRNASYYAAPYPHWIMMDFLPAFICDSLVAWMPDSAAVAGDIQGRRENHNKDRVFVTPEKQKEDAGCAALAQIFESQTVRNCFSTLTGCDLSDTWLRLELCLDKAGFWLEPHTDIGAKKLTLLLSLSVAEGAENWGTDVMTPDGKVFKRSPGTFNSALLFIPSQETWHGYEKRPMQGIRRTLILNYVDASWRAKHELAFPS